VQHYKTPATLHETHATLHDTFATLHETRATSQETCATLHETRVSYTIALDGYKQFDDKFSRFHTIVACDGQTTDILQQQSPHYAHASRGKNRNKHKRRLAAG